MMHQSREIAPGYTLYDHVNKCWVAYEGRATEMSLSDARRFIPQIPKEQDKLTSLIASGENIGVACLLVLATAK